MAGPARALILGAIALASGLSLGTGAPQDSGERPIHTRIDLPSIAACGGCHLEEHEEWSRSLHGRAWTNANVQTATNRFQKKSCRPCHSPLPVLESGLDVPPRFRDENHEDGVHCLSCHGLPDGVAAARTIEDAPCKPRFEPRLLRADFCFPCHEPTHGAFGEYVRSDAFELGLRCADCHMQTRASGRGHSHGPNGGLNPAFVARGLAWSAERESDALAVTLRNRTGHRFPGEIPSRSLLIEVRFGDDAPETTVLRKPHKGEQREDNRLEPDEERTVRFPIPLARREAPVAVRILFRPLPLMPASECFVLGEQEFAARPR